MSQYPDGVTLAGKVPMTVRDFLAAISATTESWRHHYMEAVELAELSDELYRDVPIPADLDGLPGASDTVFFGRNTGSCCHIHAHEEAVVFQLMGTKVFTLYPPADVRNLYFEPVTRDYRRSRVSFPDVDYRRFPLARRLSPIDVILEPGDALYLPVHWAHWTAAAGLVARTLALRPTGQDAHSPDHRAVTRGMFRSAARSRESFVVRYTSARATS